MITRAARRVLGRLRPARSPRQAFSTECITLTPTGAARGRCLIAYILQPFLTPGEPIASSHTHFLESTLMAQVWRDLGFQVDFIDYRYAAFQPSGSYDFFVSARKHLAEVAERLNPDCVTVAHLDTTHFATNNAASYSRLLDFQLRHGVSVPESLRIIEHNRGIDAADFGMMLGNPATRASYDYSGKPIHLLNVPAVFDYPAPEGKNYEAARHRFVYLGSGGLLHKGLDLVIEAFLGMPDLELTVCGPTKEEARLLEVYDAALDRCTNIHIHGWVDIASREFQDIAGRCVAVVFPSCAEGQAGSVVTCLRAGLLPVVTSESGVEVGAYGELIETASVGGVQEAVRRLAALNPATLKAQAQAAWQAGVMLHSRQAYLDRYGEVVASILSNTR